MRLARTLTAITLAWILAASIPSEAQPQTGQTKVKTNPAVPSAAPNSPQPAATPTPPPPPPSPPAIVMPQPLVIPAPLPPPSPPASAQSPAATLPGPPLTLDLAGDRVGIAQQTALNKGLQARILWIDGTANVGSINSQDKIDALMKQARQTGFNTIVFDVKPIVGYTLYPSRYAQKLTDWKGASIPASFDPLAAMIVSAHTQGLKLIANMATFGEGHKLVNMGPALTTNTDWQTVLYEATRTVAAPIVGAGPITIADTPNQIPTDTSQLALYSDTAGLRKNFQQDGCAMVTDFMGRVVAIADARDLGVVRVDAPAQGAVLFGLGGAGAQLKKQFNLGDIVTFNSIPRYVPVSQAPEQKITAFVNPNDPDVQKHELDIVEEIAFNYPIDGIIFDDRLRFAAINADFSDLSKQQFEQYVGHKINWPDDVFKINPYPNQEIIKGPQYQAWLVWRALTIRNWLAQARAVVKELRPNATVSVYAGSWYGEYDQYGSNWAADDFAGPFDFLTPPYQQTGFAGLLDWMTTGCYYTLPTIADGTAVNEPGATVEAGGQLSNRAANDQTWTYAGLYVAQFANQPDQFQRCIQAAVASTQGVMLFDLSQINSYNYWSLIAQVFAQPATAPHDVPGLLDTVRDQHRQQKLMGVPQPPVVVYGGVSGTGL